MLPEPYDAVAVLDLVEEFRGLVEALEREGVAYAVCGGLALAVHADPRATLDVDLRASICSA